MSNKAVLGLQLITILFQSRVKHRGPELPKSNLSTAPAPPQVLCVLPALEKGRAKVLRLPVTRLDAEAVAGCTVGLFELLGVAAADLAPSLDGAVPVQAHTSARSPEVMQLSLASISSLISICE